MIYTIQFTLSLVLDFIFGDPRWYPHPVRGIGYLINKCEVFYRSHCTSLKLAGELTVFTVVGSTIVTIFALLQIAQLFSTNLEVILSIILIYMAFSTKDLLVHSNAVLNALHSNNPVENGRLEVAKIVGRDTAELSQEGITRACVETVAENMVDGATAPVFFAIIFSFLTPFLPLSAIGCSAVGIFVYKAINTMDSMLGYKNDKYIYFGRAAARLDDFVNFLPARISGYCIIFAAFLLRLDWTNSRRIYHRDHDKHSSPNAAHPEAAVAGALGVQLGGPSIYFGKTVAKPYIGDAIVKISAEHIKVVNQLVVAAILIFACAALFSRQMFSVLMT